MPFVLNDEAAVPINLAAALGAAPVQQLPIPFISQRSYRFLCWAACCAMVMKGLHDFFPAQASHLPTTVEDVAKAVINTGACTPPGQSDLDQRCWPDCAVYELIGEQCTTHGNYIDADLLIQELVQNRRPVMIYIEANGGQIAHVVLIIGYDDHTGFFLVHDPAVGPCKKHYNELFSIDSCSWTKTFYNIGYSFV
jgi:hypothetical protein